MTTSADLAAEYSKQVGIPYYLGMFQRAHLLHKPDAMKEAITRLVTAHGDNPEIAAPVAKMLSDLSREKCTTTDYPWYAACDVTFNAPKGGPVWAEGKRSQLQQILSRKPARAYDSVHEVVLKDIEKSDPLHAEVCLGVLGLAIADSDRDRAYAEQAKIAALYADQKDHAVSRESISALLAIAEQDVNQVRGFEVAQPVFNNATENMELRRAAGRVMLRQAARYPDSEKAYSGISHVSAAIPREMVFPDAEALVQPAGVGRALLTALSRDSNLMRAAMKVQDVMYWAKLGKSPHVWKQALNGGIKHIEEARRANQQGVCIYMWQELRTYVAGIDSTGIAFEPADLEEIGRAMAECESREIQPHSVSIEEFIAAPR